MTTTSAPSKLLPLGKLILTRGVSTFIETGEIYDLPYDETPTPLILDPKWRRHWLSVCVTSHASGDWGDTCSEDAQLNDDVRANPGTGGRLMSTWHRSGFPKLWIITDDYGGPDCYTTCLWPSEY